MMHLGSTERYHAHKKQFVKFQNICIHRTRLRQYHKVCNHVCYRQDELSRHLSHMTPSMQARIFGNTAADSGESMSCLNLRA